MHVHKINWHKASIFAVISLFFIFKSHPLQNVAFKLTSSIAPALERRWIVQTIVNNNESRTRSCHEPWYFWCCRFRFSIIHIWSEWEIGYEAREHWHNMYVCMCLCVYRVAVSVLVGDSIWLLAFVFVICCSSILNVQNFKFNSDRWFSDKCFQWN